jgi:hypothetical protein
LLFGSIEQPSQCKPKIEFVTHPKARACFQKSTLPEFDVRSMQHLDRPAGGCPAYRAPKLRRVVSIVRTLSSAIAEKAAKSQRWFTSSSPSINQKLNGCTKRQHVQFPQAILQ